MVEEVKVKSKEKKYRGLSIEELKRLDVRECAKYLPARSRRCVLRNFYVIVYFIKNSEKKLERKKKIRTHLRDIVIVPRLVGMTIGVHNGKSFQDVLIELEMIGHRLGEFAMTRVRVSHSSAGIGATKGSRAKKK